MNKASGELVKSLKKQKRENHFLLFLDNQKIIADAIAQGASPVLALCSDESLAPNINCPIYLTSQSVIESLSDVKTPRGVVVMLEYPQDVVVLCPKGDFLVLDGLQDPGNVGSLIRSALAFNMECVFLVDSVHPTNSKVVRSSVGAIFNIPIYSMSKNEFIKYAQKNSLKLAKADMQGENIFDYEFKSSLGIVVGNEGNGVSEEISNICSVNLSIPMNKKLESLNAAVSGSIIMAQVTAKRSK